MQSDPHLSEETADELPPLSVGPASRRLRFRGGSLWIVAAIIAAIVLLTAALAR